MNVSLGAVRKGLEWVNALLCKVDVPGTLVDDAIEVAVGVILEYWNDDGLTGGEKHLRSAQVVSDTTGLKASLAGLVVKEVYDFIDGTSGAMPGTERP